MALLATNTKLLVAEILVCVGVNEKSLEQIRLALAKDRRFTTESVFATVSQGRHVISLESLHDFFSKNGIVADLLETERLLHWYKGVRADCLEHSEYDVVISFIEMVVPKTNQKLREEVERRNLLDLPSASLDYEVQYLMSRLFEGLLR